MKNQKTYENKGKKYLDGEKETILMLFQEGYSMKEIARMMDRKIRSIEYVIHEQIRNSIILTDEQAMRAKILMGIVGKMVRHPLSKDVVHKFQDIIQWGLMEHGEYTVDEILEMILVETQLVREEINLQKLVRNNPDWLESDEGVKVIDKYQDQVAKPMSYHMTIRGVKENITRLNRFRNNILGK